MYFHRHFVVCQHPHPGSRGQRDHPQRFSLAAGVSGREPREADVCTPRIRQGAGQERQHQVGGKDEGPIYVCHHHGVDEMEDSGAHQHTQSVSIGYREMGE